MKWLVLTGVYRSFIGNGLRIGGWDGRDSLKMCRLFELLARIICGVFLLLFASLIISLMLLRCGFEFKAAVGLKLLLSALNERYNGEIEAFREGMPDELACKNG